MEILNELYLILEVLHQNGRLNLSLLFCSKDKFLVELVHLGNFDHWNLL